MDPKRFWSKLGLAEDAKAREVRKALKRTCPRTKVRTRKKRSRSRRC